MGKNKYHIWSEGYRATGGQLGASYHGCYEGDTFEEACKQWALSSSEPNLFDPKKLTYWGCRLFDNEIDARKSFG